MKITIEILEAKIVQDADHFFELASVGAMQGCAKVGITLA